MVLMIGIRIATWKDPVLVIWINDLQQKIPINILKFGGNF